MLSHKQLIMLERLCSHCVTPPKLLSTTNAEIFSFISPVFGSFIGVLAKTVKTSAKPPLLTETRREEGIRLGQLTTKWSNTAS